SARSGEALDRLDRAVGSMAPELTDWLRARRALLTANDCLFRLDFDCVEKQLDDATRLGAPAADVTNTRQRAMTAAASLLTDELERSRHHHERKGALAGAIAASKHFTRLAGTPSDPPLENIMRRL